MPDFSAFAGQEIASGIRPNEPVIAFENESTRTVFNNLSLINGMIPKIGRVLVRETRILDNPLDRYFRKTSLPFGVGFEDVQFMEGSPNKKNDGTCIPHQNVDAASQLNLLNLAWSIDISIYDREIDKAVLTPEEAGQYIAQKMRTMRKTLASLKMKSEVQLISDVIDGTRSISSTDQSDGTGTSVTYNPTIAGYCASGAIDDTGIVLPELVSGTIPTFAQASDAMDIVKSLENAAAEMREESTTYSALGIETFLLDRPLLIMETRTLNAMDNVWAMDGTDKRIPTRTSREFLSGFAELVEIPKFASLPTNANYTDKRLAAVMIDRDSLTEALQWEDTESQRCTKNRMTGFNLAGASAMSVYRGNPAFALLTDTQ